LPIFAQKSKQMPKEGAKQKAAKGSGLAPVSNPSLVIELWSTRELLRSELHPGDFKAHGKAKD
jgi:hypothetical protein